MTVSVKARVGLSQIVGSPQRCKERLATYGKGLTAKSCVGVTQLSSAPANDKLYESEPSGSKVDVSEKCTVPDIDKSCAAHLGAYNGDVRSATSKTFNAIVFSFAVVAIFILTEF